MGSFSVREFQGPQQLEASRPQDSLTNGQQTWGESCRYVKHIGSKWLTIYLFGLF